MESWPPLCCATAPWPASSAAPDLRPHARLQHHLRHPTLVVGLITAELRRRSESIWPGVAAHLTNNLIAQAVALTMGVAS